MEPSIYWYKCGICGEAESFEFVLPNEHLCECGCKMEPTEDHFDEVEYIDNCAICRNKETDKCFNCRRS